VKRIFIALIAGVGAAWLIAGAEAQRPQYPVPTTTTTGPIQSQPAPDPQPPPPPPAPTLLNCNKQAPKLGITRATFDRVKRTTSILAPITTLASGLAKVELLGGGRITEFNVRIDSARGLIRATRGIDEAQARASTAILTIRYPGDPDTRPQTLRLRAGLRAARLSSKRPTISRTGQLDVAGAITKRAKGVVRVSLEWVNRADGSITVVERLGKIGARVPGRWGVRSQLAEGHLTQIANRCSTVQANVLFTGLQPLNMRGEMRAFQVMPKP
jgi:hypothetical protein